MIKRQKYFYKKHILYAVICIYSFNTKKNFSDYKDIDVEVFDNIGDILAVILFKNCFETS